MLHQIVLLASTVISTQTGMCWKTNRPKPTSTTTTVAPVKTLPPAPKPAPPAPKPVAKPNFQSVVSQVAQQVQQAVGDFGCLALHNTARALVGAPPLTYSSQLASTAQSWSDTMAATGSFHHSGRSGENIYMGDDSSCAGAMTAWLAEKANYSGQPIDGNFGIYGHYTQIVWKETTQVGCGRKNGYVTCNYSPAGNILGVSAY
ncbi:hypothetical protein HK103_006048 [Boothiomyces macroporosus]|uniref:SCP domain-containing protein n=1 Tax=Boothiomyces macroporosus TaxID=261099 RepID=A0AAD5UED3_9FUNG|nr:hypothetical protein HK103_006048 [Boothiomyces macroporosus]